MSMTRTTAVLLVGVSLSSCTANPDRGVTAPDVPFQPSYASSGLQQQVTGHANIILPVFGNAEEKYSNSAIRHEDGSVSGQFELKSAQDDGLRIHGDIVCFTIVGNTARLAGRITQSDTPLVPEGTYVLWSIVDRGEGNDDPPDLTSDFVGPVSEAAALAHCEFGLNVGAFMPVLGGNLQVHE